MTDTPVVFSRAFGDEHSGKLEYGGVRLNAEVSQNTFQACNDYLGGRSVIGILGPHFLYNLSFIKKEC